MIEIPLGTALIIYSTILLSVAFAVWLYTELSTHRAYRALEQQYLWRCVFCSYTYLDEKARAMSRCPRCSSYNTVGDDGAKFVAPAKVGPSDTTESDDQIAGPRRNPSKGRRGGAKRRGPRRRG